MFALVFFRKLNPNLTVTIELGGPHLHMNPRSFLKLRTSKKCRADFVDSAVDFMEEYNFDGLNFNAFTLGQFVGIKALS